MAKVKKGRGVTSVRNGSKGTGRTPVRKAPAAKRRAAGTRAASKAAQGKRPATKAAKGKAAKVSKAKATKARPAAPTRKPPVKLEPIPRFAIKELDPIAKCGPDTSVQFLYRVDESLEGRRTPHLVFFDHHGWYCEHGRTCPAVAPARKHNGHIARAS